MLQLLAVRPVNPEKSSTAAGDYRIAVRTISCWLLSLALSGCVSAPVKLPESAKAQIKTVRIVAIEAPPLEVVPDLLETRMPVYAHYDNMALPLFAETKLYRLPGELLVVGRVGEGDSVQLVEAATADAQTGDWLPSMVLSQEAVAQLNAFRFKVTADRRQRLLPLAAGERDADLVRWHDAVEQWYERDVSRNADAGRPAADAVLEVGIGRYRIFAGQLALQVLIKVIEPKSGEVIARACEQSTGYEAPEAMLLARDGAKFKQLLRRRAANLLARGFQEIGLAGK